MAALRDAYPRAVITWIINPEWAPLLRGNPDVNHVHIFPRGELRGLGASRSLMPWIRKTKEIQPDLALDFQGLLRSALIAKASKAGRILGLSDGREGSRLFYHGKAKVHRRQHAVERYLKLAELGGAPVGDALRCPIPSGDPLPRFDEYPPFILLHPFARGQSKSLSGAVIEGICQAFAPTRIVVVGKSSRKIKTPDNCVELTNQTSLLQLIRLIRVARFIISVDSGPMHIAAAVTDRLLSIHTWTDPRRVGPYNPDAWIWKNGEIIQVRELESAKLKRRGRSFKARDIPAIVELIRPQVPIDPMLV